MIDLGTPRDLNQILGGCWSLYRAHFPVFATIALAVVVPMDLISFGLIEGHLSGGFDSKELTGGPATTVVQSLVTVPLITAAHVTAVMRCGEGGTPRIGESLSEASGAFPLLIGTVVLYSLGVLAGCVALILPGIYLAFRWYVATQAVVAEGASPVEALRRSGELVKDTWWRVFGIAIVIGIVGSVAGAILGVPIGLAAAAADSGPLLVLGNIVADSVILSFTALAGTLLYFDLRVRKSAVPPPSESMTPPPPPSAPERPV